MGSANVDNRFEQPQGGSRDNPLVLDGTVKTSTGTNLKTKIVTVPIGDVSTSGSVFIVPGIAGTIVNFSNVIDAAITVADAGLTLEIDGVLVTGSAITITQVGSAAGDVDQATPTALNTFTSLQSIEIVKDGLSTTASNGVVTLEILPA
ncbi:hypothetical protein LCGC14_2537920 [marine sediment metagenome]|uniref:Uncharacterized protein n=1 Tax=marine sediment metagenome TaxID=412755 RepID=A0A0F9D384_9ZZZZ